MSGIAFTADERTSTPADVVSRYRMLLEESRRLSAEKADVDLELKNASLMSNVYTRAQVAELRLQHSRLLQQIKGIQTEIHELERDSVSVREYISRELKQADVNVVEVVQSPSAEPPRPLRRSLPAAAEYPVGALGLLAAPVQRLHEVIQAPLALCGQSILAATALAVQPFADLIIDGRVSPLSENFLTVGESGERKSAVDRQALASHYNWQRATNSAYQELQQKYENELLAYTKQREADLKKAKTRAAKEQALQDLGDPPGVPLDPHFLLSEPTYEGLVKLLAVGLPSLGIFSDEGGRMVGGHALGKDQQLKTLTGLSELWDGKPISRVRGGDGSALLYGRRVSLHLMMQPVVASELFNNSVAKEQGFLSRCLVSWPDTTAGTRQYKPVDLAQDPALQTYWKQITEILNTPWPVEKNSQGKPIPNQLKPRFLPLSDEAKTTWTEFHDHVEAQLAPRQSLDPIRAFGSKAAEHLARIAGVLTLYRDLHAKVIKTEDIKAAIALVNYYIAEALRLAEATQDDPDLLLAEKLLSWMQDHGSPISLVDVYKNGLRAIRDVKTARKILAILENHGWLIPLAPQYIDGQFRREVWEVRT